MKSNYLKKVGYTFQYYLKIFKCINMNIELFKYLVTTKPLIAKEFWSHVIDMKLVTRKEHEKKYLSFKLFLIYENKNN